MRKADKTSLADGGRTGGVAPAAFAFAMGTAAGAMLVYLHLAPGHEAFDPRHRFLSEYALGPNALLMAAAFCALAVACAALAMALRGRRGPLGRARWLPEACLLGAAASLVAMAVLRTDPNLPGTASTWIGRLHNAASALCFGPALLAMLTWRPADNGAGRMLRSLGAAGVVALAVHLLVLATFSTGGWPDRPVYRWSGATERLLAAVLLFWLLVAAYSAMRPGSGRT